jgi:hypothetical protein
MEISSAARTELDRRFRVAVIIVASQIATAFALIIFTFLFVTGADSLAPFETLMPLWVGVLFVAVGAFLLRRRLYNWERLKDAAILKGISGLLQILQKNAVLLGAMAELVTILGVVIAFLSGNRWEILRAGAVSLVVFAIIFPRKSVWTKIVSGLENK